jgi:hypothetical protein
MYIVHTLGHTTIESKEKAITKKGTQIKDLRFKIIYYIGKKSAKKR